MQVLPPRSYLQEKVIGAENKIEDQCMIAPLSDTDPSTAH
jgi:hypothetical protein